MVNLINTAEAELAEGGPLSDQIINEVILPKNRILADIIASRIQQASGNFYAEHQEELEGYVKKIVADSMDDNKEMNQLNRIPIVGKQLNKTLDAVVGDVTYKVIDQILRDLSNPNNKGKIITVTGELIQTSMADETGNSQLRRVSKEMMVESLQLIKDKVKESEWKKKLD